MKKRYIVAGVFILLSVPSAIQHNSYIGLVLQTTFYAWFLFLIASVEKGKKDGALTSSQKIQVIITEIVGSFWVALFYNYCWKDKFPIKAKQASKYFWVILSTEILLTVIGTAIYFIWLRGQYNAVTTG